MFISVLDLFKIGIGPSSSHTMGPMVASADFRNRIRRFLLSQPVKSPYKVQCMLKGSLAFTGKGHATDRAVILGLQGYLPQDLANENVDALMQQLLSSNALNLDTGVSCQFNPVTDVIFDTGTPLPQHPNGMIFEVLDSDLDACLTQTYFSIGGGFINTVDEISSLTAPLKMESTIDCPYGFDSAGAMLVMAEESGLSVAEMKRVNELSQMDEQRLQSGLDGIWDAMCACLEKGLNTDGILPGGLNLPRRAKALYEQFKDCDGKAVTLNDWLCAYAMAVNEENAAGHMVVTAPTNGAAGVIPAVLYYFVHHENGTQEKVRDFLLTAAAIGGLIKHRSSISGAEVGCQGEVGSAAAMAAAGLCAAKGGSVQQVENAAEIALEHHLGMTCDPVKGLVQVPCIERNGFGAIKAYTAASLALRGTGKHFMPLDNCIEAMKQTGQEMSQKFKETSQGGLAVSITEC